MRQPKTAPSSNGATPGTSPVLLHSIRPNNLLSFGPDTPEIPLGSLNVLIGPNGSGKSNLIETVALLRSCATDLAATLRRGGGVTEWIWKGSLDVKAALSAVADNPKHEQPLRHCLEFVPVSQAFLIHSEEIEPAELPSPDNHPQFFYRNREGVQTAYSKQDTKHIYSRFVQDSFERDASILTQLRDPQKYPEITHLFEQYSRIRLYREWQFGRESVFRIPQRADMRTDRLEEDFSNLGLFLNRLRRDSKTKKIMREYLRDIYEGVDDFDVSVEGGTVQVFLTEGEFTIPATRLSDGTLRYLCLLAILCDPKPPPLICIEEPELGLHPDILPKIADLLVEASGRTQLIVTTHSDILVDAMTERPEAVLVCEKQNGQTQMTRLNRDDLSEWLKKYRLGELWTRGEIGGVRW